MLYGDISQRLGPDVQMVDSFEDQDYSEYTDYESGGGTGAYTFNTSKSQDGSVSAELTDNGNYPKIISTSGLDNYPVQGDEITFYTYHSSDTNLINAGFYYGASDLSNLYFTRLYNTSPEINIEEKSGGTNYNIISTSTDPAPGWLKWVIQWDDGSTFGGNQHDHHLTLTRVDDGSTLIDQTGSANNHQVTSGGVGLWGGVDSAATTLWDYIHISN